MKDLILFVAPNTCARVPTIALEQIGVPFETLLVRTKAGQQRSAAFLAVNPKGKVPALLIDGAALTENVAILSWLDAAHPEARLLPEAPDALTAARQTADLAFFAGTLHPLVTRIAMPMKLVPDDARPFETVRPKGAEDMAAAIRMVEDRLADGPWWYGADWSVVDGYLFWVWDRIGGVGFDGGAFPNLRDHHARSRARPAVARAMAREAAQIEILKAEGNYAAPR